jgi:hypothetical protein
MPDAASPRADPKLSAVICADWGKESRKRSVYVADVVQRTIRRLESDAWTLAGILRNAEMWASRGTVMVAVDAPLGIPASFLSAVARLQPLAPPRGFLNVLEWAKKQQNFFVATSRPEDWRVERPFFAVPGVPGGLTAYRTAAGRLGVNLDRTIDRLTRANTAFATSGIPGSVGSGACALWRELQTLLQPGRNFRVWPFDGKLDDMIGTVPVIVGEMYPRAAYATALLDSEAAARPQLKVKKTDGAVRSVALAKLLRTQWVQRNAIQIENVDFAAGNEDDFDACITCAALLRCVVEQLPLCSSVQATDAAEGGILGTGTIDLSLPERQFQTARDLPVSGLKRRHASPTMAPYRLPGVRSYPCPIPECTWVFKGSRGGWDGHVGSLRTHPNWHPELKSPEERRNAFAIEFREFFLR